MTGFGLFSIGDCSFAVPLVNLRRILENVDLHSLPCLPAGVDSVLVYESALIPVVFTGSTGRMTPTSQTVYSYVLVDTEYGVLGLAAEPHGRIVAEQKGRVAMFSTREDSRHSGNFIYQGRVYRILDVDMVAMEITRGNGMKCLTPSGARRLDEEETVTGR